MVTMLNSLFGMCAQSPVAERLYPYSSVTRWNIGVSGKGQKVSVAVSRMLSVSGYRDKSCQNSDSHSFGMGCSNWVSPCPQSTAPFWDRIQTRSRTGVKVFSTLTACRPVASAMWMPLSVSCRKTSKYSGFNLFPPGATNVPSMSVTTSFTKPKSS